MNNRYEEKSFTDIVKRSMNLTDIARNLGLSPFCGNRNTIKKYIKKYNIDTSHFRIDYSNRKGRFQKTPLNEILIENSTYSSYHLKNRLYEEGLKKRKCELCGQDEIWQNKQMSLILDHINGTHTDNRFENLRIVCPNCNATLPTHGGKNTRKKKEKKKKHCSCGEAIEMRATYCGNCNSFKQRKIDRPPYEQLKEEIQKYGYSATGRKYGVSDNAIRKWIKFYKKHGLLG